MVTAGLVLFTDNEHQHFDAVMSELSDKALHIQFVGKAAEAQLGKPVSDPLPIGRFSLGERDVVKVGILCSRLLDLKSEGVSTGKDIVGNRK